MHGRLVLAWQAATDNSGSLAGYEITLDGKPLAAASATKPTASVLAFNRNGPSVFRVSARDARRQLERRLCSGRRPPHPAARRPSRTQIPNWGFQLFAWQQAGQQGKRPAAPLRVPSWYWRWAGWRLHPFRVV